MLYLDSSTMYLLNITKDIESKGAILKVLDKDIDTSPSKSKKRNYSESRTKNSFSSKRRIFSVG